MSHSFTLDQWETDFLFICSTSIFSISKQRSFSLPSESMSRELSTRQIYVNNEEKNQQKRFISNQVHTTKYTPLNFLLYFLLHELSRPANIFFCLIIIIQVQLKTEALKRFSSFNIRIYRFLIRMSLKSFQQSFHYQSFCPSAESKKFMKTG